MTGGVTEEPAWPPLYQAMVVGRVDYRPWEGQGLGDKDCFVCSLELDDDTRTVEDVIPKWMQRQLPARHPGFGIVLPNLTTLPPGRVLVPACLLCNGTHLGRIETAVATAFRGGPEAVSALPERTLRIWLAKIAYGLRRNDMRLHNDIRDPNAPMIATKADLAELQRLHLLLQEARDVVHVTDGHSTFFVFRSQSVGCNVCDFDFAAPIGWPYPVMVRLGEVTLMGAVDDRGALDALRSTPAFVAATQLSLHPVQVRALWALLVHYCKTLRQDRLPIRFGVSDRRLWVDRLPPVGEVVDESLAPATVDQILGRLLGESDELIAAHGGATGFLCNRAVPRRIQFEEGVLQLDSIPMPGR